MIERKEYLDRLVRWKDKKIIKVITGIRRCGKSTLLELYREYLLTDGISPEQIIAINLEDFENRQFLDSIVLHKYILNCAAPKGKTYIFLDEIQNIPNFQPMVVN